MGENMHDTSALNLDVSNITSKVYTIAPTQMEYIAKMVGDTVADSMNMRAFAPKIRSIAMAALTSALDSASHMGESHKNK